MAQSSCSSPFAGLFSPVAGLFFPFATCCSNALVIALWLTTCMAEGCACVTDDCACMYATLVLVHARMTAYHPVQEMMTSPIALSKLGWFLMEARQHQTTRHKDVIMVSPPNQGTLLFLQFMAWPFVWYSSIASIYGMVFCILESFQSKVLFCFFSSWHNVLHQDLIAWQ